MKTKEFIKKVEELGFEALKRKYFIEISSEAYGIVATVGFDKMLSVDTDWGGWDLLPKIQKEKLFELMAEYTKTPLEEREEEKKFWLKHIWIKNKPQEFEVLNKNMLTDNYFLSDSVEGEGFKTKFTLKEIEEIKEKYNTDLSDFELVEVKE